MAKFMRIRGCVITEPQRLIEDLVINVERIVYVGEMDHGAASILYEGAGGNVMMLFVDEPSEEFLERLGVVEPGPTREVWPKSR